MFLLYSSYFNTVYNHVYTRNCNEQNMLHSYNLYSFYSLILYNLILHNFRVHIHLCKLYIDDFTTVSYIGDVSMAWRLFYTAALPDDRPMRGETCRSFIH